MSGLHQQMFWFFFLFAGEEAGSGPGDHRAKGIRSGRRLLTAAAGEWSLTVAVGFRCTFRRPAAVAVADASASSSSPRLLRKRSQTALIISEPAFCRFGVACRFNHPRNRKLCLHNIYQKCTCTVYSMLIKERWLDKEVVTGCDE
ncbi:hypothetical protein HPP92_003536 [Vanilla planifolia]|uniref:C3H1-type domain-containing protein n=1 Tax=Vanilla planifolia TaxID=51239 RepID=A0A835RUL4_VANPL|nr:hypothetical protein HPP92_003536 [Vanilla planifolia]